MRNDKTSAPRSVDDSRVRMGAMTPSFPPTRATPPAVKDEGPVQMGAMTPTFPS
jgi:hypothetical protein